MKSHIRITIALAFLLSVYLFNACSKNNEDALPPVSQSGSNTFACMINGRPYVACTEINPLNFGGNDSRLRVTSGEPNSTALVMVTKDKCSYDGTQDESINLTFSINSNLTTKYTIGSIRYYSHNLQEYLCPELSSHDFKYFDTLSSANYIRIQKYDVSERIASGEFEFDLLSPDCNDTLHISQGRFDVKF